MSSSLVSPTLQKYLKKMFTFGNTFHTHPYRWNEGLKRGELCTSKWQLAVWYLNLGITAIYSIYLVGRGLEISFSAEASSTEKVYIKFILFYLAFPALFQVSILLKKEELAPFYHLNATAVRVYQEHIRNHDEEEELRAAEEDRQLPPRPSLVPKLVDRFFDFVWYGFRYACGLVVLVNCARPESPEFISSFLAPASGILRWPVIFLSAIFQMYYVYGYVANSFLFIFQGFAILIPADVALSQIKSWLQMDTSWRVTPIKVQRILDLYRSVEIIWKGIETTYCDIVVPASQWILVSLCIFCAYGSIRMEGVLAVFLGVIGVCAIGILIPMISTIAMLNTVSQDIYILMREPRFQFSLTPAQKKEVKALHVIQVRMRRGYILDKECVKSVYQIIVDTTVDMLLTQA